jgi:ABC-type dipeptide/oligopeptide/nickel transport system permease subunit
VLVSTVVLVAILAPLLIPPEFATRMDMRARLAPPSLAHPFGTDQLGRDLMYRVLLGAQTSLGIALRRWGSASSSGCRSGSSRAIMAGGSTTC